MITDKTKQALRVLKEHPGVGAKGFALYYFIEPQFEYLFTAVSNQGNGACAGKKAWLCAGKKAWLCAGIVLGKLAVKGFARRLADKYGVSSWYLTSKGENALGECVESKTS